MGNLHTFLDEFLNAMTVERGVADNTRAAYSRDLGRYLVFLEKQGLSSPGDVSLAHLQAFLAGLRASGLAPPRMSSPPTRSSGCSRPPMSQNHEGSGIRRCSSLCTRPAYGFRNSSPPP